MMGKLLRSFQKRQSIASRIRCFLLVLAMVVTMVPALGGGNSTVQAAEKEKNLTIHFMMPSDWGWKTPAVQFWGGTYAVSGNTVSGNNNTENADGTEIPGWGGAKGFFMSKGKSVGNTTEYTLSVKGTFIGFQFFDFSNTDNTVNPAYDIRQLLRQMYIIFKKMEHGHIIWTRTEQKLFRLCKHQNIFVPSVFTLRNQMDGRRQLLIAGEIILRLQMVTSEMQLSGDGEIRRYLN